MMNVHSKDLSINRKNESTELSKEETKELIKKFDSYVISIAGKDAEEFSSLMENPSFQYFDVHKTTVSHTFEHRSLKERSTAKIFEQLAAKTVTKDSIDIWKHNVETSNITKARTHLYNGSRIFRECSRCDAKGKYTCTKCRGVMMLTCPSCNGRGENRCGSCSGRGWNQCRECEGQGQIQCTGGGSLQNIGIHSSLRNGSDRCSICGGMEGMPGRMMQCSANGCTQGKIYCYRCDSRGTINCSTCGTRGQVRCPVCDSNGDETCSTCSGKKHHMDWLETVSTFEKITKINLSLPPSVPKEVHEIITYKTKKNIDEANLDDFSTEKIEDSFLSNTQVGLEQLLDEKPKNITKGVKYGVKTIRGNVRLEQGKVYSVSFDFNNKRYSVWFDSNGDCYPNKLSPIADFAQKRQIERGETPDPYLELCQNILFDNDLELHRKRSRLLKMNRFFGTFLVFLCGKLALFLTDCLSIRNMFYSNASEYEFFLIPISLIYALFAQILLMKHEVKTPEISHYITNKKTYRPQNNLDSFTLFNRDSFDKINKEYLDIQSKKRAVLLRTGNKKPFLWEIETPDYPIIKRLPEDCTIDQHYIDNYLTTSNQFWKSFFVSLQNQSPEQTYKLGSEKNINELSASLSKIGVASSLGSLNLFCILKSEYIIAKAGFCILTNMRLLINVDGWISIPLADLISYQVTDAHCVSWLENGKQRDMELYGTGMNADTINKAKRFLDANRLDKNQRFLLRVSKKDLVNRTEGKYKIPNIVLPTGKLMNVEDVVSSNDTVKDKFQRMVSLVNPRFAILFSICLFLVMLNVYIYLRLFGLSIGMEFGLFAILLIPIVKTYFVYPDGIWSKNMLPQLLEQIYNKATNTNFKSNKESLSSHFFGQKEKTNLELRLNFLSVKNVVKISSVIFVLLLILMGFRSNQQHQERQAKTAVFKLQKEKEDKERKRLKEEERQRLKEEERQRLKEEQKRRKVEESEQKRLEEQKRKKAEESEQKRLEEEKRRKAEESKRKRLEEEALAEAAIKKEEAKKQQKKAALLHKTFTARVSFDRLPLKGRTDRFKKAAKRALINMAKKNGYSNMIGGVSIVGSVEKCRGKKCVWKAKAKFKK